MLEYNDRVYGNIIIKDEIILELIKTKEFQKLKYIEQYGIPAEMSNIPNFSRFEHSLGVYTLLNKQGCSLKEQIVGLLHDVSHTAFSHTVDFIFANSKKQDYQDSRHYDYIKNSSIGTILEEFNYDIEEICDLLRFSNVKTKDGSINADNLDYGLREISYIPNFGIDYAKKCYNSLKLNEFGYLFENKKASLEFVKGFMGSRDFYESQEMTIKYYIFSCLLKKAYDKDIINENDFNLNDYKLIDKIINSRDDILISIYNILKSNEKYFEILDINSEDFTGIVYTKYRALNPIYKENNKILNLIDNDINYKQELEKKQEFYKNGFKFKITNYILKTLLF